MVDRENPERDELLDLYEEDALVCKIGIIEPGEEKNFFVKRMEEKLNFDLRSSPAIVDVMNRFGNGLDWDDLRNFFEINRCENHEE